MRIIDSFRMVKGFLQHQNADEQSDALVDKNTKAPDEASEKTLFLSKNIWTGNGYLIWAVLLQ